MNLNSCMVQITVRPSKLRMNTKTIKKTLEQYSQTKIRLLAEIPSVKLSEGTVLDSNNSMPYYCIVSSEMNACWTESLVDDLQVVLSQSEDCLRTAYQLSRNKANEVLVWVLSNKNRHWSPELPNSVPVAYGLKDYKFTAEALRKACNYVLSECAKRDLKIPLLAFDGQWYSVMVRDASGKPLTKLQLQKDGMVLLS